MMPGLPVSAAILQRVPCASCLARALPRSMLYTGSCSRRGCTALHTHDGHQESNLSANALGDRLGAYTSLPGTCW
eukprot:1157510-Pelagomonas_calceolata.AAC.28